MIRLRPLLIAAFMMVLVPAASQALTIKAPKLIDVLRSQGGFTVPESWLGIWTNVDSTFECSPRVLTGTDAYTDTICTGDSVEPDTTGGAPTFTCSGTVTDFLIDLTCTGSMNVQGCAISLTFEIDATRVGETVVSRTRIVTDYAEIGCFGSPDTCDEFISHSTRIGPPPPGCATPTRHGTWGELKARYR